MILLKKMNKHEQWSSTLKHTTNHFHNYKTDGLSPQVLQTMIDLLSWQTILNTKGTTWRKLDEAVRNSINNESAAKQIMLENTSMIKRPILLQGNKALAGFSAENYQQFFEN